MKITTIYLLAFLVSGSLFAQSDIVTVNGDFETPSEFKVWNGENGTAWSANGYKLWAKADKSQLFDAENSGVVAGEGVDESGALKLVVKKGDNPFDFMITFDDVKISEPGTYTISFKVKSQNLEKVPFWLVAKNDKKEDVGTGSAKNWKGMNEEWKEQTLSITTSEKDEKVALSFGLAKADNTYWFDDMKVVSN